MKRLLTSLLLAAMLVAEGSVSAQLSAGFGMDTTKRLLDIPATIASGTLMATGSMFTFVPEMKAVAVDLRDAVQADGHSRLKFDDYVQYVPLAMPPVLKMCGFESRNELLKMSLLEGGSYLFGTAILYMAKYGFDIQRPDGRSYTSFPSGHTFTAFVGAEVLRKEYGEEYPWLAVAGYTVASVVGVMRVYNNRHWMGDVLAGAGLALLSVNMVYWLFDVEDKEDKRKRNKVLYNDQD